MRGIYSSFSESLGASIAIFWHSGSRFRCVFLFFYALAQCADRAYSLFLLGVTAFGVFAVPLFLFFRGVTVGIGVSYFLWRDELWGMLRSALIYTPAAAAIGGLLLMFAVRSLVFSECLAKVSFSSREGNLDLKLYFHDLLLFLSFAVGISSLGCVPALVYSVFF